MNQMVLERQLKSREPARRTPRGFLLHAAWGFMALLVIAMMMPLGARAQLTGKGAITGTVMDKTGAVIPGADVAATNDATGITTKTVSTSAGNYYFTNLDPAIYTVTTNAKGFQTLVQKNIHVNALESQAYNPVLTVAAAGQETITVTAAPPQLETSNAALGATMEEQTYSELPIEMGAFGSPDQRRATDFEYVMPGVQGNETNGNATTNTGVINGSGSRGAASDVYVDGVPFVRAGGNGDPRYVWTAISVDAVEQFQVQTIGYSAAYEGQGVMNYTVKQGGSQLHGSVYDFVRNTALDTWGFFGKAPNPATGVPVKPIEHSNEYGILLSGPLIPFGSWKHKVFFFGNYDGFRYSSANPTPITFPTAAEQAGDFSAFLNLATPVKIYDPSSQAACTANSTDGFCRYQYGYGPGTSTGPAGNPLLTGTANVIPQSQFSTIAKNMQKLLPTSSIGTGLQNNYIAPNKTGLTNWSTTDRIDYLMTSRDTLSFIAAIGRQASSNPVGQTTAGRNVGPVPFNHGQTYAPKTAVGIIEEVHVFTPNLLNKFNWGYARYNGPTFNPAQAPAYAATTMGISGLPPGTASQTFPFVTFSGSNPPTQWGGQTPNVTLAENYTVLDSLQWNVGRHSFTFGGQVAWMLYNTYTSTGGSTPLTLATANTETGGISKGSYTVASNTGVAYASFLIGQVDKGSFTDYSLHPEYGARFRAISPYVQDDWKINSKLTVNLGLRYDFYPSVTEVHNFASFYNPSLANPVTGLNGALAFTGQGSGTCNCSTPVSNYYKNWGPRLGLAYQLGSKTVVRASYGVIFSHGDAIGGLASSVGTLGFAGSPSFSSTNDQTTMPGFLAGGSGAIPTYAPATGVSSGAAYGTGYTKTSGYTGTPSTMGYADPYYGSRAPEYLNWTFGVQRQLTGAMALTLSYVGSEGHFLQLDSYHARGLWADDLDPKYLSLGNRLADTGTTSTTVTSDCSTYGLSCPGLSNFATNQPLSTLLKPFPFQTVTDSFGYVGNSNYHALQAILNMREWHGLTIGANYAYSRIIDDGGNFRTGYPIPAGTLANHPSTSYPADRIERTVSTSNQPQHFAVSSVWHWPFGKTILAENAVERAIMGGFALSGIFSASSGSPLAITASSCQTNQAASTCMPTMNPNFSGPVRQNGKWGDGATWANYTSMSYITPSTGTTTSTVAGPFINPVSTLLGSATVTSTVAPAYTFGDSPRTAPYGLVGPGNYGLDLGLVRSFPLHFTESAKLDFRAEWYNITNHTQFAVASTVLGNSSFGQITSSPTLMRKSAQFSARISF